MMEIEWGIDTGKIAWLLDILSLNIEQSDAVAGVIQQNCQEDNSLWVVYCVLVCNLFVSVFILLPRIDSGKLWSKLSSAECRSAAAAV